MTDDHDALARAAGSLRRAAKAAEALDRDPLAARLLHGAVRAAEVELARLRQDADSVGAWEPTFKLDGCENLSLEDLLLGGDGPPDDQAAESA